MAIDNKSEILFATSRGEQLIEHFPIPFAFIDIDYKKLMYSHFARK